jgi:hypothetical protein
MRTFATVVTVVFASSPVCAQPSAQPKLPYDPEMEVRYTKKFDGTVVEKGDDWFSVRGSSGKVHRLKASRGLITKPKAETTNDPNFDQIRPHDKVRVHVCGIWAEPTGQLCVFGIRPIIGVEVDMVYLHGVKIKGSNLYFPPTGEKLIDD